MVIHIDFEDDAWETLRGLLDGTVTVNSPSELTFGDWVKTSVYIPNDKYNSAFNAYMALLRKACLGFTLRVQRHSWAICPSPRPPATAL